MVHGLEADYWGQVTFLYIDREAPTNQTVTQQFGISSQPIIVLLDAQGSEVERFFGFTSEEDLRAALDGLLSSG